MKNSFVKFYFEDGYVIICRGMSKHERKIAESKHGKIIHTCYE